VPTRHLPRVFAAAGLGALCAWAAFSYASGGLVWTLFQATPGDDRALDAMRQRVAGWGAFGPVAYMLLVIVEVLVAPIPGTLLYAPGGAIFGGFLGGTLSLAGNAAGAAIACLIARLWREPLGRALDSERLERLSGRLAERGFWLILLLRLNPLTSSDLVSYAAGLVGVPAAKVFAGTLIGMAPLCYAQAYFADRLFRVLPGSAAIVVGFGVAYLVAVILIVGRARRGSRYTDRSGLT
jgi:uncharacterized membrane protein YdjX (TVP38/TMEM64 family)